MNVGRLKLPAGWIKLAPGEYAQCGESLLVRRSGRRRHRWLLFHRDKAVPSSFPTAQAAIDHAEDARIHGH